MINGTVTPVFRYKSFVAGDKSELKTPAVALTLNELLAQNTDMPLKEQAEDSNHYAIGTYDNVTKTYGTLDSDDEGETTPGIGYRMRATSGAQGTNTLSMTGTPRTGDINIAINNNGDTWNLIGNPYTSALKVGAFLTANSSILDESHFGIYAWDGEKWVTLNNNNSNQVLHQLKGFSYQLNLVVTFSLLQLCRVPQKPMILSQVDKPILIMHKLFYILILLL